MTTHPMHLFDPAQKGRQGRQCGPFVCIQQQGTMFF